ncbi:MAG TPA: hypothetical protein VM260_04115 [Pirellula sp.]|nr:hypothetical protein [Pirellula sp.]
MASSNIVSLLNQPSLRALLEQGATEPFVSEILSTQTDSALATLLVERISNDPSLTKILAKFLKRITVKVVHLSQFHPSKSKLGKNGIELVVREFRRFLESAIDGDNSGQSMILEIK